MSVDDGQSESETVSREDVAFQVELLPAGEGDCLLVTVPHLGVTS